MQKPDTFADALRREPAWMQEARKAALRTPPDTRLHDTRLRPGQFRNNNRPR